MTVEYKQEMRKPVSGFKVMAVIPARYGSSRFPGKPLVDIGGKPMIQHVWERVNSSASIDSVLIATDDIRIQSVVEGFGGEAVMTSVDHPSGTDRMWEVAERYPDVPYVMNVQGDEPFLNSANLDRAVALMATEPTADIVTLVTPLLEMADYENPNVVKAVLAGDVSASEEKTGRVLYFSRASLPFVRRDALDIRGELPSSGLLADNLSSLKAFYRHLGLYLYRRDALERFTMLPPSSLERLEKLEQLRALEAGMAFYAAVVNETAVGVDTPEDLQRLNA